MTTSRLFFAAITAGLTSTVGPGAEPTVVLSPFTVATDRDTGFVAATSLAGGRLTTDLKDTPTAYSVLTRDFIDALNLRDTEQALAWAVNAYNQPDNGTDKIFNLDAGVNIRSRGTSVTGVQRNFFLLGVNSDTFSQERIDFARGPNALLIGNSSLGGSIISVTKRARTDRTFGRLELFAGSWENLRATVDLNLPLNEKVALRVNGLWQNSDSWRDWIFDNRKGVHLAATLKPFKKTEVRVEYEVYQQKALQTLSAINDRVSGWDGVTIVGAPTATVANSATAGISRLGSATAEYPVYIPAFNSNQVVNYANTWRTIGGGETATTAVGGVLPRSITNLGVAGAPLDGGIANLPTGRFALAAAKSAFRAPGREFVISPDAPTATYDFRDTAIFVEQQVGEHLFLEAASNFAETQRKTEYITTRGIADARIDVNSLLPNGGANPYYLQAYGEGANGHTYFKNNIWDTRVGAAVVFDGTRWGSFRGNVIAGNRWNEQRIRQYVDAMNRNPDPRLQPSLDLLTYRYYWNDPSRPFTFPSTVNYIDPVAGTSRSYTVRELVDLRNPGNNRKSETEFTYLQAAVNAKLWKDRLSLIAGARRDRFQVASWSVTSRPTADYPSNWDGSTVIYRPAAPADYYALTYVPKTAAGVATGPAIPADTRPRDAVGVPLAQYAGDRFRDDYSSPDVDLKVTTVTYGAVVHAAKWLTGYANYAETFNPSIAGQTITGSLLPPQQSKGWDAGVRFTLLNERLSASLGRYRSEQANSGFESTSNITPVRDIINANVKGDQSPNGINARNLAPVPAPVFDFQKTKADGYEVDLVANLTRNWRLTFNIGFPKTYTTGRFADLFGYLEKNEATLRQIVLDAGGLIGANNVATIDASVPVANRSPDVAAAVNGWNSLQTFKLSNDPALVSKNRLLDRTANLFSDYRFTEGLLKGLRVGAGVQYRGKAPIGNRAADTIVDPNDPTRAIDDPNADGNTQVYMSDYYLVTATLGYEYKLRRNVTLSFDLRVTNVFDENKPIYIAAGLRPPNGDVTSPVRITTPTTFYYLQPRAFTLSTSLRF